MEKDEYLVKLDFRVSSVGVILMEEAEIGKIELIPDPAIFKHRIDERAISIHYSPDNNTYYKLPKDKWNFALDEEGRVEIILKETVTAKAFKVHCKADDRNKQNEYVDISTFYNDINEIVNIYQRSDSAKIEYEYDAGGNRTERHTIVGNDDKTEYEYYEHSNRLKRATYSISGEIYKEWYYIYDENGNLNAKGNEVTEYADSSLTLVKDTVSSRYWEYEYSADNRLKAVYYLGELQAEYNYDADGKRIVSDTEEKTTYFVFNYAGKAVFEEKVDANSDSGESSIKQTSFIYALSKQIARVEGVVGGDGEVVYYHHDNLGSTRMMTDESGEIIFEQDYLPFGGDLAVVGDIEPKNVIGEGYKYTGQKEEASIGLYYYGARFYDPEIGRFISEDTYAGELNNPQSQNIYIYVLDNPLKYVDPTGNYAIQDMWARHIKIDEGMYTYNDEQEHIDYLKGFNSFKEKYTFEGELQRYKLVSESDLSLLRLEQKMVAWIPWAANGLKANLERNIWNLVSGNSVKSIDKVKEGIITDLVMGTAGKYSSMSQYDKNLSNLSTLYQESKGSYNLNEIKEIDRVAFDLMEQVNISVYGNNKHELISRINFVYGFIEKNKNYFMKQQKSYGVEGFKEFNISKYQYEKIINRIVNRPIISTMDSRLSLQTRQLNLNLEARNMANNYQSIISDLQKQYWGYWDYTNQNFVDGYYQYNIDHNYRPE